VLTVLFLITLIYLMSSKVRHTLFKVFAVLAFAVMLYHTICAVQPFDATPAWRHTLFIGINTICIYGLLKRPKWFVWFFGLLTIQQLYSHGSHFIQVFRENKINPIDAAVLLLMPLIFILLLQDRKSTN